MTGKEALRILSECANGEKKLFFSDSLDLEKIVSKRLEKLEKLEKAFEILKDTFQLDKSKVSEETTMYFLILKDYCWEISQEEYEPLEEVMKDDN